MYLVLSSGHSLNYFLETLEPLLSRQNSIESISPVTSGVSVHQLLSRLSPNIWIMSTFQGGSTDHTQVDLCKSFSTVFRICSVPVGFWVLAYELSLEGRQIHATNQLSDFHYVEDLVNSAKKWPLGVRLSALSCYAPLFSCSPSFPWAHTPILSSSEYRRPV